MKALHTHCGRFAGRLLALALCAAGTAAPLHAQEYGIIEDVQIRPSMQGQQIRISFTKPAQYTGHTPKELSRQLFIDLRLTGPIPTEVQIPQKQELRFKPTDEVPLRTVSYREIGRDSARLELDFSTPVRFQVSADSDYRGVTVTLVGEKEPQASPAVEKRVAELMEQARTALVDDRNFARAIALYKQVLAQPANSRSREALELLGLSHERTGQWTKAKSIYEDYLKRYPRGEGSERVRQRLMSLTTAALPEREELRKGRKEGAAEWDVYGTFSQSYLRDVYRVDSASAQTTVSAFTTDIDVVGSRRTSTSDSRMRVTAGHYLDLMADGTNDTRISSLYAEHHDRKIGWWTRAGRQTSSRDGTLGRFDGIKLGYELSKGIQTSVVAGHPVDSTRDGIDNSRTFAGLALDLGPYADSWEFSLYGIEQRIDSLIDRRAVGGEMRYFRKDLMVLGLVDYDSFYKALNIGSLLANWTLKNELTLSANFDVRKTPVLSTRNALIGLTTASSIAQLRTTATDDAIYQMARANTSEMRTVSVGASKPFSERLRLAADFTVMRINADTSNDNEYFINLQAIGTGVLNGDDISSVGLNLSDSPTARGIGIYGSSRLPVGKRWVISPRLRVDHRTWKATNQTQWTLWPAVRAEYTWNRMVFEGEIGGDWTNRELATTSERTLGIYSSIGYRYEF